MDNNNIYFFLKYAKKVSDIYYATFLSQPFYSNLVILDVSQPKKQYRQDNSSTSKDSSHTKKITNKTTFTSAQIQTLTGHWSNDPYPNRSKIERISQEFKIPFKRIEVNSMS